MTRRDLIDKMLDELRKIGDPQIESVLTADQGKKLFDAVRDHRLLNEKTELASQAFSVVPRHPELDVDKLLLAQRLFATYSTEIASALLLAALPQAYAAQWGSRVLVATTKLHEDFRRRILGTAQLLVFAMRGAKKEEVHTFWTRPAKPEKASMSMPWKACLAVRLYHEAIRQQLERASDPEHGDARTRDLLGEENTSPAKPLNQEDLLGTLLSFTITVFEVLERYGIAWTADGQEAYLYAWDLIGERLGIGNADVLRELPQNFREHIEADQWKGLRPRKVEDTRLLLDQLRGRQWAPLPPLVPPAGGGNDGWEGARAGRVLVRALLDELAAAMPRRMQGLPIAVMRALAPDIVRDRLALGGGGLAFSLLDLLPKRRLLVERFTALPVVSPVGGFALRTMANQVATQFVVRFIQRGQLDLPGLEDWADGLSDPMHMAGIR